MNSFQQVTFNVRLGYAEKVTEILQSYGAMSVSTISANEQECFDVAVPGEPEWEFQKLSAIFDDVKPLDPVVADLSTCLDKSDEILVEIIEDQDWERKWLDSFKPVKVGEGLWICPSWCEPVEMNETNVIIDPGLAFGTGSHETTQLCLEYLSSENLETKTIIDFGCGSGILGIAGVMLGAESALAVDIDPRAVQAATENARINNVAQRVLVMSNGDFKLRPVADKADIVIANILAQTIIELSEELSAMVQSGGKIILSGILAHQANRVIKMFSPCFEFLQKQRNDWVILIGQMKSE